jgi:hypothetical protein
MTFPSLPAPQLEGYTISPQDRTVRSSMDGGVTRVRQRTTARPVTTTTITWHLNTAQLTAFRAWHQTEGAAWFNLSLKGGIGTETVAARITNDWQATPITPTLWAVTAAAEVQAFTALGAQHIEALTAYDDLIPAYTALHPWVAGLKTGDYYP